MEDFSEAVGKSDDGSTLDERSRQSDSILPSTLLSDYHGI